MDKNKTILFATWLCLTAITLSSVTCGSLPKTASTKPHIILIVADDLGYNDVSFHGSDQIPTPNIDFLAYNGIILNNYYVSPICTPTRSALMTGRHPIHTGMQHSVIVGSQLYGLPLNETIMPQYFNKLGYRSHIVGKWHLGMFKWDYTPLYRGFESHLGYYQGCEDYYTHTYEANLDQWGMDFRKDKELVWNYTSLYSTDIFRDEAVRIINQHDKSEPLFLYLPFQAVHSGNGDEVHLQAPESLVQKFSYIQNKDRRTYADVTVSDTQMPCLALYHDGPGSAVHCYNAKTMLSALDSAVGAVYDTLKANNMLNNSIIVFTTDNGGPANGFDFNAANNYPLRGVKATLWEGGVRGVGLIHSPLLETQGYVSEQMLHVCDWLPTLFSAAGGDTSALTNLDGFDAWKMLSTNGSAVRSEMLHNIDPIEDKAAIRVGDFKLLLGHISQQWGGWYPPYQLDGDEVDLHYLNYTGHLVESTDRQALRATLWNKYRHWWPTDVISRMNDLNTFAQQSGNYERKQALVNSDHTDVKETFSIVQKGQDLIFRSELDKTLQSRGHLSGQPVTVSCGPKPANASTNCNPTHTPCLYHIPSDPCEYNNIAAMYPQVVSQLTERLSYYVKTMIPPGNKPYDDAGNPKYHQGAWVPWQ